MRDISYYLRNFAKQNTKRFAKLKLGSMKKKIENKPFKSYKSDAVKKAFIESMRRTMGNATESCEAVHIARSTYYEWLEKDAEFKAAMDAVAESNIDLAEKSLMQQIKDGNPTSTIFFLKTKGKKRGYIETQEITGRDGKDLIPRVLTKEEAKELWKKMDNDY